MGILMLGPGADYPAHHHVAEELYITLAGTAGWRNGAAPYTPRPPGSVTHHPSQVVHAMKAGAEPLLALYIWRGGDLAQKSNIAGA